MFACATIHNLRRRWLLFIHKSLQLRTWSQWMDTVRIWRTLRDSPETEILSARVWNVRCLIPWRRSVKLQAPCESKVSSVPSRSRTADIQSHTQDDVRFTEAFWKLLQRIEIQSVATGSFRFYQITFQKWQTEKHTWKQTQSMSCLKVQIFRLKSPDAIMLEMLHILNLNENLIVSAWKRRDYFRHRENEWSHHISKNRNWPLKTISEKFNLYFVLSNIMSIIEKQHLAREMQWLLWRTIGLKGEDITDLRLIAEALWIITQKIESDIYYFLNPEQQKSVWHEFHFIKK